MTELREPCCEEWLSATQAKQIERDSDGEYTLAGTKGRIAHCPWCGTSLISDPNHGFTVAMVRRVVDRVPHAKDLLLGVHNGTWDEDRQMNQRAPSSARVFWAIGYRAGVLGVFQAMGILAGDPIVLSETEDDALARLQGIGNVGGDE